MTSSTAAITFSKLRSGAWGIRGPVEDLQPGLRVTVSKRSGETEDRIVGRVVWSDDETALATSRALEPGDEICATPRRMREIADNYAAAPAWDYSESTWTNNARGAVVGGAQPSLVEMARQIERPVTLETLAKRDGMAAAIARDEHRRAGYDLVVERSAPRLYVSANEPYIETHEVIMEDDDGFDPESGPMLRPIYQRVAVRNVGAARKFIEQAIAAYELEAGPMDDERDLALEVFDALARGYQR